MFDESRSEKNLPSVILTPNDYKRGIIYASQNWVYGEPSPSDPSIYPFQLQGQQGQRYLVGDGHKRIAQSFLEGIPISCILDINLGEVDPKVLKNPSLAQQKFARYGIGGFFPFKDFVKKYAGR